MTVARILLTQLGYISEVVSSFSSVFRSQFLRGVVKVSIGDRYEKSEDVKYVIISDSNC
jgi:hypothetical protein